MLFDDKFFRARLDAIDREMHALRSALWQAGNRYDEDEGWRSSGDDQAMDALHYVHRAGEQLAFARSALGSRIADAAPTTDAGATEPPRDATAGGEGE